MTVRMMMAATAMAVAANRRNRGLFIVVKAFVNPVMTEERKPIFKSGVQLSRSSVRLTL